MGKGRIDLGISLDDETRFEESDFEKELGIDLDNLTHEITRHGGRYWRYGKLHAVAMRAVAELRGQISVKERGLKPLLAELNEEHRERLTEEAENAVSDDRKFKAPTEKQIEAAVLQDDKYLDALEEIDKLNGDLIEAQYTESILGLAEKLFSSRTEMLKTLGHLVRGESASDGMSIHGGREVARQSTEKLRAGMREAITKKNRR